MNKILKISFIALLLSAGCTAGKNLVTYEFPAEMTDAVRQDYIRQWEKGKVLYEINCARCHSKKLNGAVVIPDFSPEQLQGYEIRVQNARHESELPDEKVSAEELVLISTFLTYKKKNK